jgi:hypothetical protein
MQRRVLLIAGFVMAPICVLGLLWRQAFVWIVCPQALVVLFLRQTQSPFDSLGAADYPDLAVGMFYYPVLGWILSRALKRGALPRTAAHAAVWHAIALGAAVALWPFRPAAGYDIERVHPRLRALSQPYQSVATRYYMDGGSIGIEITGTDGRQVQFAIPAHLGDTNRYSRVFVGAMHDRKPEAVEVAEPEQTKRMLICILKEYPHRTALDDFCLMILRRSPVDYFRCLIHKWRGDFER